ncbi:hypothetical protein GSI_07280 [Ganoderma sinense ZZ0214-1]|uniref:MYND-type domain-containing protein n=1 Tax=Ganoderma sinense ZZ0214-1 TaxID=1077348 RepID=A0A2G8S9Y7_9APHY|nr:hypothetical protein GSI_07280 [Ganoderma sinense ZZ0214-1]
MNEQVTSGPIFPAFDVCDNCGRTDWGSERPKLCQGCKVVKYCNRECQKASWQRHRWRFRIMCRSAPPSEMEMSPQDIGYSTPMTAGRALHDWYIIHQWSLGAIGDAIVRLHGGINSLLESSAPRTIVFTVKAVGARESVESGGNPATAFKLINITIMPNNEHYATVERGSEMLEHRNQLNMILEAGGQSVDDPMFAGLFCAAHVVNKTGVVNHEFFGLYRFPLRHVPDDVSNPRTRRALVQSVEFLSRLIASGVVLRYERNAPSPEPERGRYVRTRASWRFQPIQDDWESLGSLPGNVAGQRMELAAREMVTLFDASGSLLRFRLTGTDVFY